MEWEAHIRTHLLCTERLVRFQGSPRRRQVNQFVSDHLAQPLRPLTYSTEVVVHPPAKCIDIKLESVTEPKTCEFRSTPAQQNRSAARRSGPQGPKLCVKGGLQHDLRDGPATSPRGRTQHVQQRSPIAPMSRASSDKGSVTPGGV